MDIQCRKENYDIEAKQQVSDDDLEKETKQIKMIWDNNVSC